MHTLTHVPSIPARSVTAFAIGAGAFVAGVAGVWPAVAVVLLVGSAAAVVDLRSGRIPDEFVVVALLPSVGATIASVVAGSGTAGVLAGVSGAGILAAPLLVAHLVSPAAMGFGDVKLAVALGAALGLVDPTLGLVALCVASATTAGAGIALRRSALPFGPGLVVGTTVALALASAWTERRLPWR